MSDNGEYEDLTDVRLVSTMRLGYSEVPADLNTGQEGAKIGILEILTMQKDPDAPPNWISYGVHRLHLIELLDKIPGILENLSPETDPGGVHSVPGF